MVPPTTSGSPGLPFTSLPWHSRDLSEEAVGENGSGAIPGVKPFGKAPGHLSSTQLSDPKARGDPSTAGWPWENWSPLAGPVPGPTTAAGPDTTPRAGTER